MVAVAAAIVWARQFCILLLRNLGFKKTELQDSSGTSG